METNVNELARNISKLTTEELDNLRTVLRDKYGFYSDIYKYPAGIISIDVQTSFDVRLRSAGNQKLQVVKRIKELKDIGLKYAKDLIDNAPCIIFEDISIEYARHYKEIFERIGAEIEII